MNAKKNPAKIEHNTGNLNRVRQQLRNKLIQAGLVVDEVQAATTHKKKSKHKKNRADEISIPCLHSFRSNQCGNKSVKHKINHQLPQIFSYRHINPLKQDQDKNMNNSIESSRNNSMNFKQIIRKKIMDDVRYRKLQSKGTKNDRKILKISTQGPEIIIIQSFRQSTDRKPQLMFQQSFKHTSKYRSKTQEHSKTINPEVKISKSTYYRELTPWHLKTIDERQFYQM